MRRYISHWHIGVISSLLLSTSVVTALPFSPKNAVSLQNLQHQAESDDPKAQYKLGNLYYLGEGVKQNTTEAAKWFLPAAQKGNPDAQSMLALLYYQGEGVPANSAEAERWFLRAAKQGNVDAQYFLAALNPNKYEKMRPQTKESEVQSVIHAMRLQFGAQTESWVTVCNQVKDIEIPEDQTHPALKSNCDSRALYYGVGQPVNYAAARSCAFAERKADSDDNFSGSAILMMIYANGFGVKKNIRLAERFACVLPAAEAEMEGRIKHLENLKRNSKKKSVFDLCDDITSGLMMGECAALGDDLQKPKRQQKLIALQKNWTEHEKSVFQKLQQAAAHFAQVRSEEEIDLSGTGRVLFQIGEATIQQEDFIQSLQRLELNQVPHYSLDQLTHADHQLNFLYQKLLHQNTLPLGTITTESVQKTQKAWLQYRDAWVQFAKTKYPQYTSVSIMAWFTIKRNHMLRSLGKSR